MYATPFRFELCFLCSGAGSAALEVWQVFDFLACFLVCQVSRHQDKKGSTMPPAYPKLDHAAAPSPLRHPRERSSERRYRVLGELVATCSDHQIEEPEPTPRHHTCLVSSTGFFSPKSAVSARETVSEGARVCERATYRGRRGDSFVFKNTTGRIVMTPHRWDVKHTRKHLNRCALRSHTHVSGHKPGQQWPSTYALGIFNWSRTRWPERQPLPSSRYSRTADSYGTHLEQ